jgi:lipid A ethanolaminephosphotransferase
MSGHLKQAWWLTLSRLLIGLHLPRLHIAPTLGINQLILLTALAFTLLFNDSFFHNTAQVYGGTWHGWAFLASLAVFLFAITVLLLSLLCHRFLTKPLLIGLLLLAAVASYYMSRYNIVIDTTMLTNALHTDLKEINDLLSLGLVSKLLLLGLLPAYLIYRTRIQWASFFKELRNRVLMIGGALLLALACIAPFSADYTSFFREHKILRYYANPASFVYSSIKLVSETLAATDTGIRSSLGLAAHIPETDHSRELIVLVVGEAARADHFSLNGYERLTNPLLAQQNIINFPQVSSCGTATAYSVPCMFSNLGREHFDLETAAHQENVLDLLRHAGVSVLWRDNNSDSKGVAVAVEYEDFQTPATNPVCDIECRDVGMLHGLDDWIAAHPIGDLTIVLHQMGMHGPAYYKRYPKEFEKFVPACATSELAACTPVQISNSYDNAILYTDYFLAQVIEFLKHHDSQFETAMLYVSDHGESLGENGIYLHGLPYLLAPEAQKHIAAVMWFGDHYRVDRQQVLRTSQQPLSHDDFFHTVLSLMEIETPEYDSAKDWLLNAHLPE